MINKEAKEFTQKEVFSAYKKLKHYFYYDNTSLFIRHRIAEFETSIEELSQHNKLTFEEVFQARMKDIADRISRQGIREWRRYFTSNIDYRITPKTFQSYGKSIITNRTQEDHLMLERVNIHIDAPIEVHIISVLWLMFVGKYFAKTVDSDNYAYLLELTDSIDEEKVVNGLRLYKPYFTQYQNWRDGAINKAEQLLAEKKDVAILSLDIKDYFHSVRLNIEVYRKELKKMQSEITQSEEGEKTDRLFDLLKAINLAYTGKVSSIRDLGHLKEGETILPIGLLSSGLLGNMYMRTFDKKAKDILSPAYYGRYVDDILFVFSNVEIDINAISPINKFISRFFVDRDLLDFEIGNGKSEFFKKGTNGKITYKEPDLKSDDFEGLIIMRSKADALRFSLVDYPNLFIQSKKVILQDLNHKESPAIINKFRKNLEKNRSEFRFLPDEDEVEKEFDDEAFSMHYNDSLNKLRSIKDFSEDKYGASKYLAGKIFATSFSDEPFDEKTKKQILTFFKGLTALTFHTLWEKVATYFIVNNQPQSLVSFYRQILRSIEKINSEKVNEVIATEETKTKIISDLQLFLKISIAVPLAYNPHLNIPVKKDEDMVFFEQVKQLALSIRKANLFRHAWIALPASNFTEYSLIKDCRFNLLSTSDIVDIPSSEIDISFSINHRLQLLNPRYVHFHELNILEIYKAVYSSGKSSMQRFDNIPDVAFKEYWKINQQWKLDDPISDDMFIEKYKKGYFSITNESQSQHANIGKGDGGILNVKVGGDDSKKSVNKKIAIANVKVREDYIKDSYLGKPNTSRARRKQLFELINQVEKAKCDLFVLPEVSIPYRWVNLLAYQSHRRNLGIIAGLEHWVNNDGVAFNFMVTVLPIKKQDYKTCLIKIRLKNHYSPEERRQLKGYRLVIPNDAVIAQKKSYDLFHWNKVYFSVYNCFELADIGDRSIFKSKVDFIVASEYNKDIQYFSEIGGSWSRDLHCYFVQANFSDFGDSRVIQPSSSVTKNILQIKGGENATIIVGKLDVEKLREFQLKEYDLQKDDGTYKPTPPNFNVKNVENRIQNK